MRANGAMSAVFLSMLSGLAAADLRSAKLAIKEGDTLAGQTVETLNTPFTDATGAWGGVVGVAGTRRLIVRDGVVLFDSDNASPDTATGGEGTMGFTSAGAFIYSPSFNGNDAVYTNGGNLLAGTASAPGFPALFNTFNSRPRMVADGSAYWVAGTAATSGGSTSNRVFYRATDPTDSSTITVLAKGGDALPGGLTIAGGGNGILFDYDVSDNSMHRIHRFDISGATSTTNDVVWVDGAIVMREGSPTGAGENWAAPRVVTIDNAGNYLFGSDTSAATSSDEVLVYNGTIVLREGAVVDGHTLTGQLDALSMDNNGNAAFIWDLPSSSEGLFYGPAASPGDAVLLLTLNDTIDVDGDNVADWVVTDMNASTVIGPGLELGDSGLVYIEVDLDSIMGGDAIEAIIGLHRPGGNACPADFNGDSFVDDTDFVTFAAAYEAFTVPPADAGADFNNDGFVDDTDFVTFAAAYEAFVCP